MGPRWLTFYVIFLLLYFMCAIRGDYAAAHACFSFYCPCTIQTDILLYFCIIRHVPASILYHFVLFVNPFYICMAMPLIYMRTELHYVQENEIGIRD